jgi:hypothetical protein
MASMFDSEAYVANANLQKASGPSVCLAELGGEKLEALRGDSGEQTGLVSEVVGRRCVRNAGAAGDVSEPDIGGALLDDRLQRRVDQCVAQITVVVRTRAVVLARFHVRDGSKIT